LPPTGVRLQNHAYLEFASDVPESTISDPDPGLWAIAPRLEGGGCPDGQQVCWQWDLVGRVSYDEASSIAQPLPTPSALTSPTTELAPTPTESPSQSPVESRQLDCHQVGFLFPGVTPAPLGWSASVVDETGHLDLCLVEQGSDASPKQPVHTTSAHTLTVSWLGGGCDNVIRLRFTAAGDGYELQLIETNDRPINVVCDAANVARTVKLTSSSRFGSADIAVCGATGLLGTFRECTAPGGS
jgi:hypothetical protein